MVQPVLTGELGDDNDFDWIPYPRANQSRYHLQPALLPQIRTGIAKLTEIMIDIHQLLDEESLRENFQVLLDQAEVPYNRLEEWLATWPDASQIEKQPLPQLLVLR